MRQKLPRMMQGRKRRTRQVEERPVDGVVFQDDGGEQYDAQSLGSGDQVCEDIQDDAGSNASEKDHDVVVEAVPGGEHKFSVTVDGKLVGRIQCTDADDSKSL